MIRYIIVSAVSGLLFGLMDGVINGNVYARKLLAIYEPIAKSSINPALFERMMAFGQNRKI